MQLQVGLTIMSVALRCWLDTTSQEEDRKNLEKILMSPVGAFENCLQLRGLDKGGGDRMLEKMFRILYRASLNFHNAAPFYALEIRKHVISFFAESALCKEEGFADYALKFGLVFEQATSIAAPVQSSRALLAYYEIVLKHASKLLEHGFRPTAATCRWCDHYLKVARKTKATAVIQNINDYRGSVNAAQKTGTDLVVSASEAFAKAEEVVRIMGHEDSRGSSSQGLPDDREESISKMEAMLATIDVKAMGESALTSMMTAFLRLLSVLWKATEDVALSETSHTSQEPGNTLWARLLAAVFAYYCRCSQVSALKDALRKSVPAMVALFNTQGRLSYMIDCEGQEFLLQAAEISDRENFLEGLKSTGNTFFFLGGLRYGKKDWSRAETDFSHSCRLLGCFLIASKSASNIDAGSLSLQLSKRYEYLATCQQFLGKYQADVQLCKESLLSLRSGLQSLNFAAPRSTTDSVIKSLVAKHAKYQIRENAYEYCVAADALVPDVPLETRRELAQLELEYLEGFSEKRRTWIGRLKVTEWLLASFLSANHPIMHARFLVGIAKLLRGQPFPTKNEENRAIIGHCETAIELIKSAVCVYADHVATSEYLISELINFIKAFTESYGADQHVLQQADNDLAIAQEIFANSGLTSRKLLKSHDVEGAAANALAFVSRARLYFGMGKLSEALADALRALKILNRSLKHFHVPTSSSSMDDVVAAITQLHISGSPKAYIEDGALNNGQQRLKQLLMDVYLCLGRFYICRGSTLEAAHFLEEGLNLATISKSPAYKSEFLLSMSEIRYRRYELEESYEKIEAATENQGLVFPDVPAQDVIELKVHSGNLQLRAEAYDDAIACFRDADALIDVAMSGTVIARIEEVDLKGPQTPREKRLMQSPKVMPRKGKSAVVEDFQGDCFALSDAKIGLSAHIAWGLGKQKKFEQAERKLKEGDDIAQTGASKVRVLTIRFSTQELTAPSARVPSDVCKASFHETLVKFSKQYLVCDLFGVSASHDLACTAAFYLEISKGLTFRREMLGSLQDKMARGKGRTADNLTSEAAPNAERSTSTYDTLLGIQSSDEMLQPEIFNEEISSMLPSNWIVCSMSVDLEREDLYLTRRERSQQPIVVRLPIRRQAMRDGQEGGASYSTIIGELQEILENSNATTRDAAECKTKADKIQWWQTRKDLDAQMGALLEQIELCWLGGFKGLFTTDLYDSPELASDLECFKETIKKVVYVAVSKKTRRKRPAPLDVDPNLCRMLLRLGPAPHYDVIEDALFYLLEAYQFSGVSVDYDEVNLDLLVDEIKDALASFHLAYSQHKQRTSPPQGDPPHIIIIPDKHLHMLPWESLSILRDRPPQGITIDGSSAYYVLNPSKDLMKTEDTFKFLAQRQSWIGVIGSPPEERILEQALEEKDLYLYFGHGGGDQYIRGHRVRDLSSCAVALLLGCSSGCLRPAGEFDPSGTPISYLIAGSRAVVANLWDVTDGDIDKFSQRMLEEWHLVAGPYADHSNTSIAQAVMTARDACKLKFLTGAAPVVYGIPVYLRKAL
ncbi:hypothetical protein HKX48_001242 [Thoreauomyces humboldtii]|nr:hypothetical protein HKX48_001242 [Thoreauomyces humboldtii]